MSPPLRNKVRWWARSTITTAPIVFIAVIAAAIVALGSADAAAGTKRRCVARAESHHAVLCVTRFHGDRATFRLSGFKPRTRWKATTETGETHGAITSDGTSALTGKHRRDPSFTDELISLGFSVSGTAKGGAHVQLNVDRSS